MSAPFLHRDAHRRLRLRFMDHYADRPQLKEVAVRRDETTGGWFLDVGTSEPIEDLPTLFDGLPVRQHHARGATHAILTVEQALRDADVEARGDQQRLAATQNPAG